VPYGGDSGNRIFVLYWRCPLIRVSVIRGSAVYFKIIHNVLYNLCSFQITKSGIGNCYRKIDQPKEKSVLLSPTYE
jgi:hypothetical protein